MDSELLEGHRLILPSWNYDCMQIRIADVESDNPVALSSVKLARNPLERLEQLRSAQTRLLRLHKRLDALHRTLEDSIRSSAPRKQQNAVEQALALMSRRLVQVQERERARIARELHDDIGQRLSLAACTLDTLENNLSECEVRSGLRQLKEEIFEVISAVHHVSHELHPARLQYLGFLPTMQCVCKEVGDRYRIDIEFKGEGVPRRLAPDIALDTPGQLLMPSEVATSEDLAYEKAVETLLLRIALGP